MSTLDLFSRRNQGLVTEVIFPHPRQTNKLQMVTDLMQRLQASTLSLLPWALVFVPGSAPASFAQQVNPENRKVVNRVTPLYPQIARSMNLSGSVKADVLVAPNGTAKLVEVKGGHPILVRAAQDAIYKWKWVPAAHETREAIEVRFDPQ